MVNCIIAKTKFKFNLLSKLMNKQIEKYVVDEELDDAIVVESKFVETYEVPNNEPSIRSKYYDIYYEDDKIIQVQFDEDKNFYGKVTYTDKYCLIEMLKDGVNRREYLLTEYACFYYILKIQDAIMIHSSSIQYKDHGILFIAKSGTGKSTQARLWKEYRDVVQINDDKNILILEDDKLVIYGNPWSGKSFIDVNKKVPLTELVFIYQNKENVIRPISKREQMILLMSQITNASFMYDKDKWDKLTNKLLLEKGYALGCTISLEAVETLENILEGKLC